MNRIEVLEALYDLNVYKLLNQKQFRDLEAVNTLLNRIDLLKSLIYEEDKELLEEGNIW